MAETKLIPLLDDVKYELRMFVIPKEEPTPNRPGAASTKLFDRSILKDPKTNNMPFKSKDVHLARIDSLM
jgi:hypothetical protein